MRIVYRQKKIHSTFKQSLVRTLQSRLTLIERKLPAVRCEVRLDTKHERRMDTQCSAILNISVSCQVTLPTGSQGAITICLGTWLAPQCDGSTSQHGHLITIAQLSRSPWVTRCWLRPRLS